MARSPLLLGALAVVGCVTPYQSRGFTGGFSETQLAPNVFIVNFSGNGFTSDERAVDFILLRSAELTLKAGYSFFVVARTAGASENAPLGREVGQYGVGAPFVALGDLAKSLMGRYQRVSSRIVCFAERPEVDGEVYDAAFLQRSISDKYRAPAEAEVAQARPTVNDDTFRDLR